MFISSSQDAEPSIGTFVRIGHNEVSICDPSAIRQVLMSHMDKVPSHLSHHGWYELNSSAGADICHLQYA